MIWESCGIVKQGKKAKFIEAKGEMFVKVTRMCPDEKGAARMHIINTTNIQIHCDIQI